MPHRGLAWSLAALVLVLAGSVAHGQPDPRPDGDQPAPAPPGEPTAAAVQDDSASEAQPVKRCNDPALIRQLISEQEERVVAHRAGMIGALLADELPQQWPQILDGYGVAQRQAAVDLLRRRSHDCPGPDQTPSAVLGLCLSMLDAPAGAHVDGREGARAGSAGPGSALARWLWPPLMGLAGLTRFGPHWLVSGDGAAAFLSVAVAQQRRTPRVRLLPWLALGLTLSVCATPGESRSLCDHAHLAEALLRGDPAACPRAVNAMSSRWFPLCQAAMAELPPRPQASPGRRLLVANPCTGAMTCAWQRDVDAGSTNPVVTDVPSGEGVVLELDAGTSDLPRLACWCS